MKPPSSTVPPAAPPPASEPTVVSVASARLTPAASASVTALAGSAAGWLRRSVPALTWVAPAKLPAPANTRVPAPRFSSAPLPASGPASVRVWPWVSMLPPPAATCSVRSAPSVRSLLACSRPPSSVSGAAAAPSRLSLSIASTPAWTSVPPAKLLAPPFRVQVPVPCLTRPPLPLMRPANWVDAPLPPVRNVKALSATSPPAAPPPASEPSVSSAASTSTAPAWLSRLNATPSARAAPPCRRSMPFCTRTGPLKLLLPLRLNSPLPCLTSPPLPLIAPANWVLVLLPPVLRVKPARSTPPPSAPPPASEPSVSAPCSSRPAPATSARLRATPSARAAPPCSASVPACTRTGPVNRLAPLRVNWPAPCLTRPPLPLRTPAKTVLLPLPPVLSVWPASATSPPAGEPPASEPMVSSANKAKRAPGVPSSVTATPSASAAPPCSASVPCITRTGPAKLLAPCSVNTPLPCLSSPPAPLIGPANAVLLWSPPVRRVWPARSTRPPLAPPPASDPMVASAASVKATPALSARVTALAASTWA